MIVLYFLVPCEIAIYAIGLPAGGLVTATEGHNVLAFTSFLVLFRPLRSPPVHDHDM